MRQSPETQTSQGAPQLVVRPNTHGGENSQLAMGGNAIERSMVNIGSIAVYHVKPVVSTHGKLGKKKTIFAVHVQNAITGRSWVVHRCYLDFMMLRGLIVEHFKIFRNQFPRISKRVEELYFPKKHKILYKMDKVVEHRCGAFLEFLMGLHRLLISHSYLIRREICPIGLSIFRGFLGSAMVQDPIHRAYTFHKPISPIELNPSERTPVNQCGSLTTVLEDDAEYEVEVEDVEPEPESETEMSPHNGSTESTESSISEDDSEDAEDEHLRMLEIVNRRRSQKYARNRRVLLFLRKDGVPMEAQSAAAINQEDASAACAPRSLSHFHSEKMYVRATDMLHLS